MMQWINKKRNKKGFTLIELIVVIAILGILAAIAIPRLTGQQLRAAEKSHDANLRTIDGAVAMFEAEHGVLPNEIGDLTKTGEVTIATKKYNVTPLLNSIPDVPAKVVSEHGLAASYSLTDAKKAAPLGGDKWTNSYTNIE